MTVSPLSLDSIKMANTVMEILLLQENTDGLPICQVWGYVLYRNHFI